MIYESLEIKGSEKKLKSVINFFEKNEISNMDDIERIKNDNLLVFRFLHETGMDIFTLDVCEYDGFINSYEDLDDLEEDDYLVTEVKDVNPIVLLIIKTLLITPILLVIMLYLSIFISTIIVLIKR